MRLRILFILGIIFGLCINLFAQSGQDNERFFYGSDLDKDFEVVQPDNSFFNNGIQYGAILSPIFLYDDNNGGKLTSYILNAKVWAKAYLWNNSFLYISARDYYLGVITNDGVYAATESDNLLDLDQAYLAMSFLSNRLNISFGRKYYTMGTGLVLNGRGDGAEAAWNSAFFSIKALGLYTGLLLKDNNPYHLNDKDITDGAERMFVGGIFTTYFYNQKLYLLGLVQRDLADQTEYSESRYDSEYYGIGMDGIYFGNMAYYAEFIHERGASYINNADAASKISLEKSNISAYAINSGIYYYVPVALHPMLILQYSFGSGDKYRRRYTGSNRPNAATGEDDNGFIAFGTFTGGYALRPNLGNMHILRAGFSFAPLTKVSLGAKYLYYLKDKKEAPINSDEGRLPEAFIGQGVDVSFRWQIFPDLSMYVNYGLFIPGDAYDSANENCNFIMAGINLSI